jgi:FHA domain
MAPRPTNSPTETPRRPARDLIEAVLENMRQNLEPLKYSILAPARYVVYLHPDELARLEGILPVLQEQTARALREELEKLNRRPLRKYFDRMLGETPLIENPAREWHVEFLADPDGEVQEGDILVCSDLALPEQPELGAGQRTRRITTVHVGNKTTRRDEVVTEPKAATSATTFARLKYQDDAGPHTFEIARDVTTVGRGGLAHRVDVRIEAPVDVSREHLRIRRDPQSGRFFVADVSTLGSTLNGQRLPKGYDEVDGHKKENGVEMPLPDRARLGLADAVYLDFELVTRGV